MAAPTAAFPLLINIAVDTAGAPGSYVALNGVTKFDFGPKQTLVDSTWFSGTVTQAGVVSRFGTLVDADINISGQFNPGAAANVISADAAAETLFISVGAADRYVWVQAFWTGSTHGFSLQAIVDSYKLSVAVAGVIEMTFTIKANSKPVFV